MRSRTVGRELNRQGARRASEAARGSRDLGVRLADRVIGADEHGVEIEGSPDHLKLTTGMSPQGDRERVAAAEQGRVDSIRRAFGRELEAATEPHGIAALLTGIEVQDSAAT
jgi:hypothetical protein